MKVQKDKTVKVFMEGAITAGASAIHIEPREEGMQTRYRVDGLLQKATSPATPELVAHIKTLCDLQDERHVPQDSRFKFSTGGKRYIIRVSTMLIANGEKLVLHIMHEATTPLSLEELGYWGHNLTAINTAIAQPQGLILVTGPVGSGTSTSLYSMLNLLNNPTINIATIEDTVEYRLPGANQAQINPKLGMTFAAGLRALLRQDPNIIMVGEIPDSVTADLVLQTALAGRLIFSTLRTTSAAASITCLTDMGIPPFLISSSIRAIVAQRLARRLCSRCKQLYKPEAHEVASIFDAFTITNKAQVAQLQKLEKQALAESIGPENKQFSFEKNTIARLWRAADKGCAACNHTGYRGRVGLFEVLPMSPAIQKLASNGATCASIHEQALREDMVSMQTDGLIKVLRGQTSIEEVLRVTRS